MKTFTLSVYLIFAAALSTFAQGKFFNQSYYTSKKILPSHAVNALTYDNAGNLLIGTQNGLVMNKANDWYFFDRESGLLDNYVFSLAVDANNVVWVGTSAGSYYQVTYSATDTTIGPIQPIPAFGSTGFAVTELHINKNGDVWAFAGNKLARFDGSTWKAYNASDGLTATFITSISNDMSGNIWVAGNDGFYRFDGSSWYKFSSSDGLPGSLDAFASVYGAKDGSVWCAHETWIGHYVNGSWTVYNVGATNGPGTYYAQSIAEDSQGTVWFSGYASSSGTYLSSYNGSNWTNYTTADAPQAIFNDMVIDTLDHIWGSNPNSGIYQQNGSMAIANWKQIVPVGGFTDGYFSSLSVDANQTLWASSSYSINSYDGKDWTDHSIANLFDIHSTLDKNGTLWLTATRNGLPVFGKLDHDSLLVYTDNNTNKQRYNSAIFADRDGNIWFNAEGGLLKYNGTNTSFFPFSGAPNQDSTYATHFSQDPSGRIWGTTKNVGFFSFNGTQMNFYPSAQQGINANELGPLACDRLGNVWFTYQKKLMRFDGANWTAVDTIPGPSQPKSTYFTDIKLDNDGSTLWMTSTVGLFKFDEQQVLTQYGYNEGMTMTTRMSYLTIDHIGGKWMFGNQVLSIYADTIVIPPPPPARDSIQVGCVFIDKNANGTKDAGETGLAKQIIKMNNNYVVTKEEGYFVTQLPNGTYELTYKAPENWTLTTDSVIVMVVTDTTAVDTLYWGVKPAVTVNDVAMYLSGSQFFRRGFETKYWLTYENKGTTTQKGKVVFEVDPNKVDIESLSIFPDSISSGRIVWSYNNLEPQQSSTIWINARVKQSNNLGDTVKASAHITGLSPEKTPENNIYTISQVVTGSYDPNDKSVAPEGVKKEHFIKMGTQLTYTVRFQNSGNDTAFLVVIKDLLDEQLDPRSVRILGNSHPVELDILGTRELAFSFKNINLPYQKQTELGSQGFVQFSVKPKAGMKENTMVKNQAGIYFDFNDPIITNEVFNTYVEKIPVDQVGINSIEQDWTIIQPNPAKDQAFVMVENFSSASCTLSLSDVQGKLVLQETNASGKWNMDISSIPAGLYFLNIRENHTGRSTNTKLLID